MSERQTSQSKTEPPTPKRLRDLRKKGQVARSRDVPATAVVAVTVLCLAFGGAYLLDGFRNILNRSMSADFTTFSDSATLIAWTRGLFVDSTLLSLPIVAILIGVAAL